MIQLVEVNGEGFENHVHSWFELILEDGKLKGSRFKLLLISLLTTKTAHLEALKSNELVHPSTSDLVDVFSEVNRWN